MARGFQYGKGQPGDLVIGWNGGHTAVTLPDGTPVASGEPGGVRVGGLGAFQPQFTRHMHLPMASEIPEGDPASLTEPELVELVDVEMPAPEPEPVVVDVVDVPAPEPEPEVVEGVIEEVDAPAPDSAPVVDVENVQI